MPWVLFVLFLVAFFPERAAAQAVVSAAGYQSVVAPNSIATLFGSNLAPSAAAATQIPLPTTLAGASVTVNGVAAPLFYVSPTQINFLVPAETASGTATVVVRSPGGSSSTTIVIVPVAPSLFTANSQGWGTPAAVWVSESAPSVSNPVVSADGRPLSVPGGAVVVLFGTGLRGAAAGSVTVTALAGNRAFRLAVQYAGAQGSFVGLDQVNVKLPAEVNNQGNIDLVLSAGSVLANAVRLISGSASSAVNAFVLRPPAGTRNAGLPRLASRANFAGSVADYDALQCGTALVAWDLDLLSAARLPLPPGLCMLDAQNGPGVLAAAPRFFGAVRDAGTADNARTNQAAVADPVAGSLRVAAVNHFFSATPAQLADMLVFPGQQRPRDLNADSINVVFTDSASADSRPLSAGEQYPALFQPVVDAPARTAVLAGPGAAAFVRLPLASADFSVRTTPLPAGTSALAGLGMEDLPVAGRAVGLGSGATAGQALFYNLAAATAAAVPLPSDVTFVCPATGQGHGLNNLDVFAPSGGTMAVSPFGNGCSGFLVLDGARQTVSRIFPVGITGLGSVQSMNNFAFALGRIAPLGAYNRLVVLQDGTRVTQITSPQIASVEPSGLFSYAVRESANEVFAVGTDTNSRAVLLVFRLDAGSVTAVQAPEGVALTLHIFPSRRPGRVYAYALGPLAVPQLVTFDLGSGSATATNLPDGTLSPTGFDPQTMLVLFDHRDGALAVRLE